MPITCTPYSAVYFNPQAIPVCCVWLDAADQASFNSGAITNGTTITQWNDKSGVGQSITVAGTPVWNSTTLNSSPSVNLTNGRFSGIFTNTLSNFTSTAFIITSLNSYPTGGYPCLAFQNTPTGSFLRVLDYAGGFRFITFIPSVAGVSTTASLSTPFLWATTYNGTTNMNLYYNGSNTANTTSASSPGSNAGYFYLGTEPGDIPGVNSWPGYVSEVIVYTSVLTQTQRQQVEGYLAQKWGLTSQLPAGHPGLTQTIYTSNYNYKFYLRPNNLALQSTYYLNFSPTQTTGVMSGLTCSLWLDAADSTQISFSSSTNVSTWSDKSGFGNSCSNQSVGTTITYPGTKINGLNTVNFTAGCIRGAFNSTSVINTTNVTVIIVTTETAANNDLRIFALTGATYQDDTATTLLALYGAGTNLVNFYRSGVQPTPYAVIQNSPFLYSLTQTSGTANMWLNGGSNVTASITATSLNVTNYNIGTQYLANQNYTGLMSEVIVYNSLLTTQQRQLVESYLAQKWGLQGSLPRTHPNFTNPAGLPAVDPSLTKTVGNIPYIIATGGTVTFAFGREFRTFTSNGTFTITTNTRSRQIDILCVGGGGGGGCFEGGGGGGGGFTLLTTNLALGSYNITLGNGGTGGVGSGAAGGTGGTTTFGALVTAAGGGGGGSSFGSGPSNGASGGGGAYGQSFGTGSPGGNGAAPDPNLLWGGGGGGASGAATNNNGGPGTAYYGNYYGGGGGGGGNQGSPGTGGIGGGGAGGGSGTPSVQSPLPAPTPGTPNTGGGGGGMGYNSNTGAIGGSGVVIVSFSTS
jgi:hypothetical protein